MDAIDYMVSDVADHATKCEVWRETSASDYDPSLTKQGTADVYIFSPTSQSRVVVEGTGEETSISGLLIPTRDANGDLVHEIQIADELRPTSNPELHYLVRVKDGLPNSIDPKLWQLGLDHANSSA